MRTLFIMIAAAGMAVFATARAGENVEIKSLAEGAASPKASVDDLAWLVGHWKVNGEKKCLALRTPKNCPARRRNIWNPFYLLVKAL